MKRRAFVLSSLAASWHAAQAQAPARRFRVAVIGHTGRGNFGHGLDTMWLELPETEVVAVADADSAGLEAARKKLKLERGWSDYREMLREVKPDIVSIAARHVDQHRDMALAAITAGARGLYMEKPFCRTLAEADEIIAACEKHGARLALAHRNRCHPVALNRSFGQPGCRKIPLGRRTWRDQDGVDVMQECPQEEEAGDHNKGHQHILCFFHTASGTYGF